jgi:predicted Zn-dependent protease
LKASLRCWPIFHPKGDAMRSSCVLAIFSIFLAGCAATNQTRYETPLYKMEVLEQPGTANSWQIQEVPARELENQKPGQRPPLDSDEAGIWMVMDKAETEYRHAGNLINDQDLNDYLQHIACRLAPEYCRDIRIYVLRVPYFNASMAPNGAMVIWSGLLLRAANEAQVAAVLGHEIGHYLRRHSLQRLRAIENTSGAMVVVQLATAAAGVRVAGDAAYLAAIGGLQAYSRDQEREADGYGLAFMARAGYDPHEAARLWERVIREMEASKDKKFSTLLFDSHPPSRERLAAIDNLADRVAVRTIDERENTDAYRRRLLPYRFGFLEDELHQRDFPRLEVLLDQLIAADPSSGELSFFKGELYRLRGEEGDPGKALAAFEKATVQDQCPPETFRSLGLLYEGQGQTGKAHAAFREYLKRKPDATDREMIMHMMAKENP